MEELLKSARRANLRYTTDSIIGIKRVKSGKVFKYVDQNGVNIYNKNTEERIDCLGIPPAWKNVWISPFEDSHLQATGVDSKGRKQYIYHSDWIAVCSENKFSKLIDFGQTLPEIRKKVASDMKDKRLSKNKILATVIWLLEHTFIRVGNDEYVKENKSYGLTTLRSKHVKVSGPNIKFAFRGKSGIDHLVTINHPIVAKTIKACVELPGYELFKCVDEDGNRHIIDSSDVNEFLKEVTGEDVSAKEFRTWGGTVLSGVSFHKLGHADTKELEEENIKLTVKEVSKHLRNTPKIARAYYIHPTIISTYQKKILVPHFDKITKKVDNFLTMDESRVLTLLQKYT